MPPASAFVRFGEDAERIPADEERTINAIIESMHRLSGRTHAKLGKAVRVSHAKAHGLAIGGLTMLNDLPEPLAQGLFTSGASYPAIVRLANVPGEIDSDAVATQRGLALKVLGVEGEKLPGHDAATQDFVLDSGNRFAAGTALLFPIASRIHLSWAQELCIYMFVWMAKFGAAYGVRTGIHVGVDVVVNLLSPQWRRAAVLFGLLAGAFEVEGDGVQRSHGVGVAHAPRDTPPRPGSASRETDNR